MASRIGISRRTAMMGGAGLAAAAGIARFNIARAQGGPLKVGVILPRSGVQAFIGQSCQRGADIAPEVLKELGYKVDIELMNADTETNVEVARSRAERLINEGAHVIVGAFDSGQTLGIAQVTEQKGIPLIVNIAAAPQITEQGYKTVFRIFPTSGDLIRNGLAGFKDVFAATGHTPKTAVFLHINDTFGQANKNAIDKLFPGANMPFKIVDTIAYDPAARDLSVEIAKAKATGADLAMVVTRLNDAILMIREMIKQRWEPMGIMSPGSPGMYEEQFFTALGKYSDYPISVVPWFNPKAELSQKVAAAFKKKFPNDRLVGHALNVGFTFEAILVAADAAQRAGSTDPQALIAALKATNIPKRMMIGGPIAFDAKGQNENVQSAVLQNRGGEPKVVLPKEAAQAAPVFPMPGWAKRG
jgi:branched-chain amino acid transport system substrate-binding protein